MDLDRGDLSEQKSASWGDVANAGTNGQRHAAAMIALVYEGARAPPPIIVMGEGGAN